MKNYALEDYFRPCSKFKKYYKMYEQLLASGDEEKAEEFRQKAAELVGIVYTTEEKKVDKETVEVPVTRFDSVDCVWFLHNSFETIGVSDNIAMYNFTEHHYDFVTADVYLSFFKQILDMLDVKVWRQKREQEYAKRFLRDVPNRYGTWQVPEAKIVFKNGVLDVDKDEFYPGVDPGIINFHCTGYDYPEETPKPECPKFMEILDSIFDEKSLIAVVQEMYGASLLYGRNPIQKIFLLYGTGRNGKGILCNVLTALHGSDSVSTASVAQLSSRFGGSMIYDKVLNISTENDMDFVADTALLKSVSGNNYITIDQKYEKTFQAKVFCKLIISTNEIVFRDRSRGFEERLIPVPCEYTFVDNPRGPKERKKNPMLEAELMDEIPAIFLWAYEGLKRLQANNWQFTQCDKVDKLREEILKEANPVAMFFDERIQVKEGANTKKSDVYASFENWAFKKRLSVGSVVSAQKFYTEFGRLMEERNLTSKTKLNNGIPYYKGISLIY